MELRHEFSVPVPADEAWRVLLDIERVAPCMPGATVDSFDGETIQGSVKVKVGPMTVTYRGTAAFAERDEAARRIVLTANGKEARGQGTARANVTGTLTQSGEGEAVATTVTVETDLTVTGRPAQFGRGVMAEVGDKLIGAFADCLAGQLAEPATSQEPAPAPDSAAAQAAHAHPDGDSPLAVAGQRGHDEPLDLLRVAGAPVAKRAAAAVAGLLGLAALVSYLRRCRH